MPYEAVIGLEIHAQLLTATKIFCGCSTRFGAPPNTHICPVCLGLPGALPVLNRQAVDLALRAGVALGCAINPRSVFARKNYFYPDLPKGYQISQYDQPLVGPGQVAVPSGDGVVTVGLTRIHLEEDAGKSLHEGLADASDRTSLDFNRAGVPLIEIVTEPDLRSAADASAFFEQLRATLVWIGVNDGNMEEGSLRCDANVSVRPDGRDTAGDQGRDQEPQLLPVSPPGARVRDRTTDRSAWTRAAASCRRRDCGIRRPAARSRCAARKRRTTTGTFRNPICRRWRSTRRASIAPDRRCPSCRPHGASG